MNDTVVAVLTFLVLNAPSGVPVTATESTLYGLPSVLSAPKLPATADCKAAVPVTVAVSEPSYSLLILESPLTVRAFVAMLAVAVGESTTDNE